MSSSSSFKQGPIIHSSSLVCGGCGSGDLSSVRSSQGFSGGGHCGRRSTHNSGGGICHAIGGGLLGFGGGSFGDDDAGFLSINEKSTMQNLNARLATYVDKVQSLEEENTQLESFIGEWHHKQKQTCVPKDYSPYYEEIDKLIGQLISETADENKIVLDIHNIKMTADDIELKYQAECGLRQTVEDDLQNLHALLDKVILENSDLGMQYELLKEELTHLKKDHQETKSSLQHPSSGDVTVEVNSGPGPDLKKILNNLRHEYEQIIEKNRREIEQWYFIKVFVPHLPDTGLRPIAKISGYEVALASVSFPAEHTSMIGSRIGRRKMKER